MCAVKYQLVLYGDAVLNVVAVFEMVRAVILALMTGYLIWFQTTHRDEANITGWRLILGGFGLLFLATMLDVTDNFPQLKQWVVLGDTPQMAFLEEFVGYVGGFLLLAVGLLRWMPSVHAIEQEVVARRQAELLQKEQKEFLREVIDAIPDPVILIDLDYRVLLQNQASSKRLAGQEPSSGPLRCHWLNHHNNEPCSGLEDPCPLHEVHDHGRVVTLIHRHPAADGSSRIVELTAAPFRDAEGKVIGIIETTRDISDRVALQHRLQDHEQHLRQLSWHDTLTGLYNRNYFTRRLQMALQVAHHLAVLVVDIDGFKRIHEGLGHVAGDAVRPRLTARF